MPTDMPVQPLKIAVLCSGLGHVARGVETWADVTAASLYRRGYDVTLYKGGGSATRPFERVVRCAQRYGSLAENLPRWMPACAWRLGCTSPYAVEQTTFALSALSELRRGRFDVLHTQDPWLAWVLQKTRRVHRAKVILGHGTEEPAWFLQKFEHVQELTPFYLQRHGDLGGRRWFAAPNFVDADVFRPGDRAVARERLGLPPNKYIVLCVAALNRSRKRVDWLSYEFARANLNDALLVLAGAEEPETPTLLEEVEPLLRDRVCILKNVAHADMPLLYQAADVHALCALQEVLGLCLLEAMATGLPCIGHTWGATEWVIGPGGSIVDMQQPGALAAVLELYEEPLLREAHGLLARQRVETTFSVDAVMTQYLKMYSTVASRESHIPLHRIDRPGEQRAALIVR
jgi:glycosyltransferase involved in cell wall biosynthesis